MRKARGPNRKRPIRNENEAVEDDWEWTDGIIDDAPSSYDIGMKPEPIDHTSASYHHTTFNVGDIVQLNAGKPYTWVGIIMGFQRDYGKQPGEQMRVLLHWFCRKKDVKGGSLHSRSNADDAEIYLGHEQDSCVITSIIKLGKVLSSQSAYEEYQKKRRARKPYNPDADAVFFCERAVYSQTGEFVDIDWNETYQGSNTDFDAINEWIVSWGDKITRKRRRKGQDEESDYEAAAENEDDRPKTPRKKKKQSQPATPRKEPTSAFSTPTKHKKELQITPLPLRTRDASMLESPYKLAQANLHVSAVPVSLPCREDEYNTILEHVEDAINARTGACIYISGVPGTGKTATVREVIHALQEQVQAQELDAFHYLEINGLKVLDPNQAYAMLWEAMTGERVTPSHGSSLLDAEFKTAGPGRISCVVLLDELDQLVMAKRTVLYNLFNWPTLPNSRLIVIAIANTMNLAEMLPNKIQSRVGLTRVNFEPYTRDQLIKIIEARLRGVAEHIIEKDAIKLCAMRIAANTGDARKALDVCRRAVEIAERNAESALSGTPSKTTKTNLSKEGKVTTNLIQFVLQEFLRHPIQKTLKFLPFTSKLFLAALILRTRRLSGKSHVTFGDVLEEATRICLSSVRLSAAKLIMKGVTVPRGLERAGVELEICKVIDWEEKGGRRGGRVGLQISEDDLTMAFAQDNMWKDLLK